MEKYKFINIIKSYKARCITKILGDVFHKRGVSTRSLFHVSIVFIVTLCALFLSCSSSPKRPMLINDIASTADEYFETANGFLTEGKLNEAGKYLEDAIKLSTSIDDTDLLCRASLSAIVYKLYDVGNNLNDTTSIKYFNGKTAQNLLEDAKEYASRTARSALLNDVCKIYEARILISSSPSNAQMAVQKLLGVEKSLSKEPFYLGYFYRTQGDAYFLQKDYQNADKCYLLASDVHIKNRYLFEIGVDYYSSAQARSLNGNKQAALDSIANALKYDKDAENTSAIAADYLAYAKILSKDNASKDEFLSAKKAALWAKQIYSAGGFVQEAKDCDALCAQIEKDASR